MVEKLLESDEVLGGFDFAPGRHNSVNEGTQVGQIVCPLLLRVCIKVVLLFVLVQLGF